MDHDQQLTQLREFDEQVLSQLENAQTFATKGFLETLTELIQHGLQKENDGTDAYKEELKVIKTCTRAFSTILPAIFKTVGQNEAESRLWELTRALLTLIESKLVLHENTGVKISAIKCLQVVVLLLSKSSQIRQDHRLLNSQELEKEAHEVFKQLLGLMKSDNESVLTATISCLVVIVRKRNNLLKSVANLFTSWRKSRSNEDSPVMLRNVEKAIRLAFVSLIRTEALSPYRHDLITSFGLVGGNVAMFQSRHARAEEARRQKRQAAHQEQQEREKRAKINAAEYVPVVPSSKSQNILVNYDITQIPLQHIVSLCMTVLQTVPLEVMSERVSTLPAEGVTLAAARPGFRRSTTPPYPPPPDAPQHIQSTKFKRDDGETSKKVKEDVVKEEIPVKTETNEMVDSDEEMEQKFLSRTPLVFKEDEDVKMKDVEEEKPKVEVLASVEERASQALKMKPYALAKQNSLDESDKKLIIKMSIQRIFENINLYQSLTNNHADRKALPETSTAVTPTINTNKSIWFLLVAKLMTKGIIISEQADDQDDEQKKTLIEMNNETSMNELKEMLLEFIIENLAQRHDLALDWLYEEYLNDKRNERVNKSTNNYFHWLHRLLEKMIPKLDAKDRILTKLLLDAPELDSKAIDLVKENLENVAERFVSCVSTLRSLVTNRPTIRSTAMQVLLDLCIHENVKMRRTSIVAVKKWNSNQTEMNDKVEAYSIEALNKLTATKEEDWTEDDVIRHAELFFVLCTKKPSLLKELFSVYVQSAESVQSHIRANIYKMINLIGMKSQDLIQLVREFPVNGETLVIRILSILCESKQPTREIVSAVQSLSTLAEERSIDLQELTPILSGQSLSSNKTTENTSTVTK